MGKYLLFTNDAELKSRYLSFFKDNEIVFLDTIDTIKDNKEAEIIIIDESFLSVKQYLEANSALTKYKKPIIYIVEKPQKNIVKLLDSGVISLLLKNADKTTVKKKIDNIFYNYKYLEKMKMISKKSKRTEKFFELFNSITSDSTINDIMLSILDSIQETFNFSSIDFFFVTKNTLKHKLSLGEKMDDSSKMEWKIGKNRPKWMAYIIKKKKPSIVNLKCKEEMIEVFGLGTTLMPLIIKDKFIGLISAVSESKKNKLDKHDMKLLKAYCDQTSVVLENAQLYWNVITAREDLIEQEKKNLLGQMIISLNHEINNPLSIISMEAQLLQKKFENKETKIESRIANIENNIDRIKTILEKISSLNVSKDLGMEYIKGQEMLNLELDN